MWVRAEAAALAPWCARSGGGTSGPNSDLRVTGAPHAPAGSAVRSSAAHPARRRRSGKARADRLTPKSNMKVQDKRPTEHLHQRKDSCRLVQRLCMSDGGAAGAPPRRGPLGAWRVADDAPEWFQRRLSCRVAATVERRLGDAMRWHRWRRTGPRIVVHFSSA